MINLLQKIIMNQSDVIIVMKSNIIKILKESRTASTATPDSKSGYSTDGVVNQYLHYFDVADA